MTDAGSADEGGPGSVKSDETQPSGTGSRGGRSFRVKRGLRHISGGERKRTMFTLRVNAREIKKEKIYGFHKKTEGLSEPPRLCPIPYNPSIRSVRKIKK